MALKPIITITAVALLLSWMKMVCCTCVQGIINDDLRKQFAKSLKNSIITTPRPKNIGVGGIGISTAAGAAFGSITPGAGNIAGAAFGFVSGVTYYVFTDVLTINGKSSVEWTKEGANYLEEQIQKVMNSLESWIGF
jgi:hypothetical protein